MNWAINPVSKLAGTIEVQPDKSITHRAIMIASIAEGDSAIKNYLPADDCMRTLGAFEKMGIKADREARVLRIKGAGLRGLKKPAGAIDAGNSGTTVRLMSGILAGQNFSSEFVGDESLSRRPMKRIIEPLSKMGAKIESKDGNYLPLRMTGAGNLKSIEYSSDIASAQVKSCVLFAGMYASGTTTFTEPEKSRDHTERMLKVSGAKIIETGLAVQIEGPAKLKAVEMTVPGDISSAAFFFAAGLLAKNSSLTVSNVGINPTRDGILDIMRRMGAKLGLTDKKTASGEPVAAVSVESSKLKAVEIGKELIPRLIDELPVIALLATQAEGTTVISGARELRVKESDRIETVASELKKMGANITVKEDGFIIQGPVKLKGSIVKSHADHRIAMMLAVAGSIAEGRTTVEGVECVDTSFPGFYELLTGISRK
ncbi:MAG: 3-phosphoshikimate 1-carboxyvinyltransferase [Endomicrobiales bacterium]|nr:3-phosphoshikimate 1-carboxyvinyltransferase [Endomicrobiales bacterium]